MVSGYVNSIQTLGTLDGPGVRFVVFLQGCNLRCGCCHNPDTWLSNSGTEYFASGIVDKAEKYREYFGACGGITLSGGEPLLQTKFSKEIFLECKKRGINTCLDTSGSILDDEVLNLLGYTDRVLLDIKYTDEEKYQKYVGCSIDMPLRFLECLNEKNIPVTLRQVIIPTLNDDEENIKELIKLIKKYPCIDNVELLPFKKICKVKYDKLGIDFRFNEIPEPTVELMQKMNNLIKPHLN